MISFIRAVMISEMYFTETCAVAFPSSSTIWMDFSPSEESLFGMQAP